MINERKISVSLMDYLTPRLRQSTVLKISDRATAGIPDVLVTWFGPTFFIENKLWRKHQKLKDINKTEQLILCHQLAISSMGRCWVSIYREEPKELIIWQPRKLMAHLWPKVILGELNLEPVMIEGTDFKGTDVFKILSATGAIRCSGWNHELQRCLILDAQRSLQP